MKSLMSLWSCTADELAVRCSTSATRDIKTVASRFEHEGLSFLAISLADYGKVIQKWLDQGFVVPSDAPGFKRVGPIGFPAFLSGFLGRVFEPSSGVLLEDPCIESIYAVRQLTLMFSKIAYPGGPDEGNLRRGGSRQVVSPKRSRKAMLEFLQCEQDVRAADARLDPLYLEDFRRMSAMLFGDFFAKVDRDIYWGRHVPKHGPGAVADKLTSNGKWNQRSWPARLVKAFPPSEFLLPNASFRDGLGDVDVLEPGAELPVRVITVPKTLKTPRIIAIEPTAMQYCQQSLLACFLDAIREDDFLSRIIGLDDQDPNRAMAAEGSHSGDLATLDLSEASDRVSNQLVRALFAEHPLLDEAVQACRSRKADVPGHGVLRLAKFASMGSALCFPVEAMVFTTIIFLGIERELSALLDRETLIRGYSRSVRVFGDDLIVPRDHVLSIVDELSNFGCKVNVSKSFWTGRFRESCGREYYDGQDVSIVKVRAVLPTRWQDATGVESAVALRNLLYWGGLWASARWLDSYLRDLLSEFPNVAPSSPVLGRESALGYEFQRTDPNTHGPLVKGHIVRAKAPEDFLEGSGALLKCLLRGTPSMLKMWTEPVIDYPAHSRVPVPIVDEEHLERSGRPEHVIITLGWASPY